MATRVSPIDLQKALKGISYPAAKSDLVACAKSNAAPDEVLQALDDLPDPHYDGPDAVSEAVAGES